MNIRTERPADLSEIAAVVTAAFLDAPHRSGTEAAIVAALREAGVLTLSLVAEDEGTIVGHIAFSPVTVDGVAGGWFGLGPVAVRPDRQRVAIGSSLIVEGLRRLRARGAHGCVVLGDPAYYGRFGFACDPSLRYPDAPAEYFQRLSFDGTCPAGIVVYQSGFSAA